MAYVWASSAPPLIKAALDLPLPSTRAGEARAEGVVKEGGREGGSWLVVWVEERLAVSAVLGW